MVHTVGIQMWLGRAAEASGNARQSLGWKEHPSLSRHLVLALALRGDADEAAATANSIIRNEDELLLAQSMLAAIHGKADMASRYQTDYLGRYGPDDRESLVLTAVRGDRGDANRIAATIDARPFGHVVLLQAIYDCLCGAPFDLDATPNFKARIGEAGFRWPPPTIVRFPAKDW